MVHGSQQAPVCLPHGSHELLCDRFPLCLCFLSQPKEGYLPAVPETQPHWAELSVYVSTVYLFHLPV